MKRQFTFKKVVRFVDLTTKIFALLQTGGRTERQNPMNWTPIRRGEKYCSPACGGGCTWSAYKRAHANGKALAKRLGKGWKVRVWENLGWHWEVINGVLRVDRDEDRYCCMIEPHYAWFGHPKYADTPEKAIAATVLMVCGSIDEVVKLRDHAMKAATNFLNPKRKN